jgi:hypothetical protein
MAEERTFNPYLVFRGAFIPNYVIENKNVSPMAKICFGMMGERSNSGSGEVASFREISDRLGITIEEMHKYVDELVEFDILPIQPLEEAYK